MLKVRFALLMVTGKPHPEAQGKAELVKGNTEKSKRTVVC